MNVRDVNGQLSAPANFSLPANNTPGKIINAELYFDRDPGIGKGSSISITPGTDVSLNNYPVNVDTLSVGNHLLCTRTKNNSGLWSLTSVSNLFVFQPATVPANITTGPINAAEYFIDNDPGLGNGNAIPVSPLNDVSGNVGVSINSLSTGVHRFYVRVRNERGNWSLTNEGNFYIVSMSSLPANPAVSNIINAEYFIDNDPGFGKGTSIVVTSSTDITRNNIAVGIDTLSAGVHRLFVRTQNSNGSWSITHVTGFYIVPINFSVPSNPFAGMITGIEYFFDSDPGFGNGKFISVPATPDLSNYSFAADISGLKKDTTHTLYVRALDGWSQTTIVPFKIGSALPVTWLSFTGKLLPDKIIELKWQTSTELNLDHFEIERSSDGKAFSSIGIVQASGSSGTLHNYQFVDEQPVTGSVFYRIKETDKDGKTDYSTVLPFINNLHSASSFYIINNPAKNILRIHCGNPVANSIIRISDMSGRLLIRTTGNESSIQQINISSLPAGIYLFEFVSGNKKISKQFIKE